LGHCTSGQLFFTWVCEIRLLRTDPSVQAKPPNGLSHSGWGRTLFTPCSLAMPSGSSGATERATMKQMGWKRVVLAAAVFGWGSLGSVEWSGDNRRPPGFKAEDIVISASTARAAESSGAVRRASCTVVRYYVAKYSAAAAEAWARSRGATEAELEKARRCLA
jgi:hypothetical protein